MTHNIPPKPSTPLERLFEAFDKATSTGTMTYKTQVVTEGKLEYHELKNKVRVQELEIEKLKEMLTVLYKYGNFADLNFECNECNADLTIGVHMYWCSLGDTLDFIKINIL